jgi:hypothetical protein
VRTVAAPSAAPHVRHGALGAVGSARRFAAAAYADNRREMGKDAEVTVTGAGAAAFAREAASAMGMAMRGHRQYVRCSYDNG